MSDPSNPLRLEAVGVLRNRRSETGLMVRSRTRFNHRRLLEPIGNIPPAEAVDRYYAMLEQTPMAA
jgi:hypothetical protein